MTKEVALITGATRGIGRAIAEYLHDKGYTIIATGTNEKALASLKEQGIHAIKMDVTDKNSVRSVYEEIKSSFPPVKYLINSAGILRGGPLTEIDENHMQDCIDVNLMGLFRVVNTFFPMLHESNGRLIQISSEVVNISGAFTAPYGASKLAAEAYCDSLRREWLFFDNHVVIVQPGAILTELLDNSVEHVGSSVKGSLYEKINKVTQKLATEEKEKAVPAIEVAKTVHLAMTTKNPKHRYTVNQDPIRRFISRLPSPWIDSLLKLIFEQEAKKLPKL